MKIFILILSGLLSTQVAFANAGIWLGNEFVDSPEMGVKLVRAMKASNEYDDEIDVCYDGYFEEALNEAEKLTKNAISINLIDVYGESEFPQIEVEITEVGKDGYAYGIISGCR